MRILSLRKSNRLHFKSQIVKQVVYYNKKKHVCNQTNIKKHKAKPFLVSHLQTLHPHQQEHSPQPEISVAGSAQAIGFLDLQVGTTSTWRPQHSHIQLLDLLATDTATLVPLWQVKPHICMESAEGLAPGPPDNLHKRGILL